MLIRIASVSVYLTSIFQIICLTFCCTTFIVGRTTAEIVEFAPIVIYQAIGLAFTSFIIFVISAKELKAFLLLYLIDLLLFVMPMFVFVGILTDAGKACFKE